MTGSSRLRVAGEMEAPGESSLEDARSTRTPAMPALPIRTRGRARHRRPRTWTDSRSSFGALARRWTLVARHHLERSAQMNRDPGYIVGWGTLALINAGLAQGKNRSGIGWFILSLF